jgi:hypothetical protein
MQRTISAVIVGALLAGSASATEYRSFLCVEDDSTGFNWIDGKWTQTTFKQDQFVIRKTELSEPDSASCYWEIQFNDRPTTRANESDLGPTWGCYTLTVVGKPEALPWLCKEWWRSSDDTGPAEVFSVDCDGALGTFRFNPPGGEYVAANVWAAPRLEPDPKEARDSLTLGIGRCSPIGR